MKRTRTGETPRFKQITVRPTLLSVHSCFSSARGGLVFYTLGTPFVPDGYHLKTKGRLVFKATAAQIRVKLRGKGWG